MTNHTTHATISVTVDVVLFCMYNTTLHILLIERKYPPYAGAWAIPGGFVDADESLAHAARRTHGAHHGPQLFSFFFSLSIGA